MKEEIEKIEKKKTWTLVSRTIDKNVIGTKWVFKNKLYEMVRSQGTRLDWIMEKLLPLLQE